MSNKYTKQQKAEFHLKPKLALGMPRSEGKLTGLITSMGSRRVYSAHVALFFGYLDREKICKPRNVNVEIVNKYLEKRSMEVRQKTLDADRQSLQMAFSVRPKYVHSLIPTIEESRAYGDDEIDLIKSRQGPKNRFATELAAFGGLRAFELATIARIEEQPPTADRNWPDDLFRGMHNIRRYTVAGKGGLIRQIPLSHNLVARLEACRLVEPRWVEDRNVFHFQRFDLAHGQAWSQSFSDASSKALGYSAGAHGLRHRYAQDRMRTLLNLQFNYDDAREIVSSELGHFRSEITEVYLR